MEMNQQKASRTLVNFFVNLARPGVVTRYFFVQEVGCVERKSEEKKRMSRQLTILLFFTGTRNAARGTRLALVICRTRQAVFFFHPSSRAVVVKCELVIEKGHPELNQRVCVSKDESGSH